MGRRSRDRYATPGWGRGAPPIPLLRPFDPAPASADLRQGERNTLPPGMEGPYFVSRFRGGNDGFVRGTPRRIYGPSRGLCITAYHACDAIQITLHPSPRSYFDGAQHERPRPHHERLCKGHASGHLRFIEREGTGPSHHPWIHAAAHLRPASAGMTESVGLGDDQ